MTKIGEEGSGCVETHLMDVHTPSPYTKMELCKQLEGEESLQHCSLKSQEKNNIGSLISHCKKSSPLWKQFGISMVVSLFHLAAGVAFGYTGIIIPSITNSNSTEFYMNTQEVSVYTSMLLIGAVSGSPVSGPLCNVLGQKVFMLSIIPLALAGWLISYFSNKFWLHLSSRFILGTFCAAACSASTTFVAEIVDSNFRGKFLALTDFARQVGFLYVCLVGSTSLEWRVVGLVCGLSPLALPLFVLLIIPNSPRWLAVAQRPEKELRKSLQYYSGKYTDIETELKEIQFDVGSSQKSASNWHQLKLLKERSLLRRFLLLAYLNFASNLTGNYAFVAYTVLIFQSASAGINPYTGTVICGVVRVAGSLLYILLADYIGRRLLSLIFLTLCCVCTTSIGIYFYLDYIDVDTSSIFWLPLAAMIAFQVFSCLCLPVIRLLRSELLPNTVRNLGANLLYFFVHLGAFIVALTYPTMVEEIGLHWTFWFYSFNTVIMLVVIFLFLPETKGKTLEEISQMFYKINISL